MNPNDPSKPESKAALHKRAHDFFETTIEIPVTVYYDFYEGTNDVDDPSSAEILDVNYNGFSILPPDGYEPLELLAHEKEWAKREIETD